MQPTRLQTHHSWYTWSTMLAMYFDKDVVRSLVDMGMNEARAKWASHFLHDQCFAADRHAEFFTNVPGMANYIFSKRTGYIWFWIQIEFILVFLWLEKYMQHVFQNQYDWEMNIVFNVWFNMLLPNVPNAQEAHTPFAPYILQWFLLILRAYWRRILLPEHILETNDIPSGLWKCDLWPRFEKHLYVTSSLRFIRGGVVKYVWSVALPQTTFRIIVLVLVLLFFRVVSFTTLVLIQLHCMWSRKTMSEPW